MRNVALRFEYDGSGFHGWQSQINALAIHDIVRDALVRLGASPGRLAGASRTDAGVHARGQVASFSTESRIPVGKYPYALNSILPKGISCTGSAEVAPDFHARFSATGKTYSYLILNRRHPSALYAQRSWHVPLPLDAAAMRGASGLLVGTHDFRAFMSSGSPVSSTVRTITRLSIDTDPASEPGPFIRLSIEGDGFLYNMVRIIAGTLAYVGHGRLSAGDVALALASGDRRAAGKTAPPQGLCLESVAYGCPVLFI